MKNPFRLLTQYRSRRRLQQATAANLDKRSPATAQRMLPPSAPSEHEDVLKRLRDVGAI